MSSDINDLKKIVREKGSLETPSVELIEPEVRTGTSYAAPSNTAALQLGKSQDNAYNLGAAKLSITIWGFDVPLEKEEDFRNWLRDNEHKLADACPDGTHYLGTYVADARAPRGTGAFRTFWGIDSFEAMGRFGDAAAETRNPFGKILRKFTSFYDRDRAAGRSELMVQRATIVTRY